MFCIIILKRCANCFDCPSCGNTLSTRATAVAIQSDKGGDDSKATQAKKVYYLACGFCRWSSRDIGIEDKSVGELKFFLSCFQVTIYWLCNTFEWYAVGYPTKGLCVSVL